MTDLESALLEVAGALDACGLPYVLIGGLAVATLVSQERRSMSKLAKLPPTPVEVIAGKPVPDLRLLASDPKECEWAADLPFQYDALDSAEVIRLLQRVSQWEAPAVSTSRTFHAKLATGGGLKDVYFHLSLREHVAGNVGLEILKKSAL